MNGFIRTAARVFLRAQNDSDVAVDLYVLLAYSGCAGKLRSHRRLQNDATVALAYYVQRSGSMADSMSLDILRRAVRVHCDPFLVGALVDLLLLRNHAQEAIDTVDAAIGRIGVSNILEPAARAHLANHDISFRVLMTIYIPAASSSNQRLAFEVCRHLAKWLHLFPPNIQQDCVKVIETWLGDRKNNAEKFLVKFCFERAWIVLRNHFANARFRILLERAAAAAFLGECRETYPKPIGV